MLPEITNYAVPVLLVCGAIVAATALPAVMARVPAAALLLLGAAIASDAVAVLRVPIITVERVAVVALIVILFNGGRDIGAKRIRTAAGPVAAIGIVGTFLTAGLLAVAAHVLVGLDWKVAGVLGAALAPTDPAVMFSILGRREIAGRSGTILEGEAGLNDPAGIALLLGMVEVATHHDTSLLVIPEEFALAIGIGAIAGFAGGHAVIRVLSRVALADGALYPVLTLALIGTLYAATTLALGSGFIAVFIAGLLVGDARLPFGVDIDRVSAGLASLSEIAVFVALGLTVHLTAIPGRDWLAGLTLLAALALIIRPFAVAVTLPLARLSRRERLFIAWSGLKGAVPVLLAAFAVIGHVPQADRIYDITFVVVLGSVVIQGSLVTTVGHALGLQMHTRSARPWEMSVALTEPPTGHSEHRVAAGAWADGRTIDDLNLPPGAWVTLIVRDGFAVAPHPATHLTADDRVHVIAPDGPDCTHRFAATTQSGNAPPA